MEGVIANEKRAVSTHVSQLLVKILEAPLANPRIVEPCAWGAQRGGGGPARRGGAQRAGEGSAGRLDKTNLNEQWLCQLGSPLLIEWCREPALPVRDDALDGVQVLEVQHNLRNKGNTQKGPRAAESQAAVRNSEWRWQRHQVGNCKAPLQP